MVDLFTDFFVGLTWKQWIPVGLFLCLGISFVVAGVDILIGLIGYIVETWGDDDEKARRWLLRNSRPGLFEK